MQKWEYLFVVLKPTLSLTPDWEVGGVSGQPMATQRASSLPEFANQMGDQGWELVSILGNEKSTPRLIFKRPKEHVE
jgi:hypothetical protein